MILRHCLGSYCDYTSMNYVTTNIRLPEESYLKLKEEAFAKRKSLAAVIREKINIKEGKWSNTEIERLLSERDQLAKKLAKKLKGFDIVKALREMREEGKW